MIHIAICDDENVIVNQIESIVLNVCNLRGIPVDFNVFYCGGSLEKSVFLGFKYDIIFLDIQMGNGDGVTAAKNIRKLDENVLFIYVSGYGKYMIELFQLDVFAFIAKPIERKILSEFFLKAYRKVCNNMYYFSFRYKNEDYKIPCKDILYFESRGRRISTYLQKGEVKSFNGKLSEVEKKLSVGKTPFVRIHQSFLVNYYLIKSKSKTEVTLLNGTRLPISADRQKSFNRQYSKLLGGEIDFLL